MTETVKEKMHALRALYDAHGIDAYIIPRADAFQNEFVRPCDERLHYITGFTGSAGLAVIGIDNAYLLTDARYTQQAKHECSDALLTVIDTGEQKPADVLGNHDGVIGYDPWLFTIESIQEWHQAGVMLKPVAHNLIDAIWDDRPAPIPPKIFDFPDDVAGRASPDKIQSVCDAHNYDVIFITACDSVSWLMNKRSATLAYSPAVLSYAYIDRETMTATLFDQSCDFSIFKNKSIALDPATTPMAIHDDLADLDVEYSTIEDPCTAPKAIKTNSEINAIKHAHVIDGVAMVKFLYWLEHHDATLTELDCVDMLEKFRCTHDAYQNPSFPTIAGFGANGAIIHYRPTQDTNATLKEGNFLLLDSGGQYGANTVWGTTDITRTIPIGDVSYIMKAQYTRVLMGHIDVAMHIFPYGETGKQIDALARKPLQDAGYNYAHGTGHGVGCYLNVHESASNLSPRVDKPVKAGMLLSNEPGYYETDAYGIRIENLIFAYDVNKDIAFETITYVPIETACICPDMMNDQQIEWLNMYHMKVFETLAPHLDDAHVKWLEHKTKQVLSII